MLIYGKNGSQTLHQRFVRSATTRLVLN